MCSGSRNLVHRHGDAIGEAVTMPGHDSRDGMGEWAPGSTELHVERLSSRSEGRVLDREMLGLTELQL